MIESESDPEFFYRMRAKLEELTRLATIVAEENRTRFSGLADDMKQAIEERFAELEQRIKAMEAHRCGE